MCPEQVTLLAVLPNKLSFAFMSSGKACLVRQRIECTVTGNLHTLDDFASLIALHSHANPIERADVTNEQASRVDLDSRDARLAKNRGPLIRIAPLEKLRVRV